MANPFNTGGPGHPLGVPMTTTNSPARQRYKWELAIRFQLKYPNAKQSEVAHHIGIDVTTLSQWQADPDWQDLRNQILTGILSHIDEDLIEDVTKNHLTLRRLVPVAIQNLADLALQRTSEKLRLEASREILDREGHFSKVARLGAPTAEQGGVANTVDNEMALKLQEAFLAAKQAEQAKPITIESPLATETKQ